MSAPAPAKPATASRVLWAAWDAPVAANVFTLASVDGRGKERRQQYRFRRLFEGPLLVGWSLEKWGTAEVHHVQLAEQWAACDCAAALFDKQRTGGICKHLASLYLLRATGLPPVAVIEIERHLLARKDGA